MKFNKIWFFYTISKLAYMFIALFVYSRFTQLGDTDRYLSGRTFGASKWWYSSTHMMDFLAHLFSKMVGPILANVPFIFLAVYGVYYSVERAGFTYNQKIKVLLFLSLPSFSIWSSIASKEAVGVFFLGIILGFVIDVVKCNPKRNYILVAFAFYLCAIFKPQYLIGVSSLLIFIYISRRFSFKGVGEFLLFILFFVFSILALYIFRDPINELSFIMPDHFSLEAGSTRENTIWVNDFDVFWNAPYGMYIAFMGPTVSEALSKPTHFLAFLESLFILLFFLYALFKLLMVIVNTGRINIFFMSVFLVATLWILFVHYPFGALNPGSAIRYRENFYGFFVVLFYFCYIEVKRNYEFGVIHRDKKI